jgi:hypothetical protein
MKKLVLIISIAIMAISNMQAQDTLYVYQKVGGVYKFAVSNVDSLLFFKPTVAGVSTTSGVITGVGQSFGGGKVGYIFVQTDPGYVFGETHGLIVSNIDLSTGTGWNNGSNITTYATATGIGSGLSNTNKIIATQGTPYSNYAAGICKNYNGGGYTDWYLPSLNELQMLCNNNSKIGGMSNNAYWSSSELTNSSSWAINFYGSYQFFFTKTGPSNNVRAVRTF